MAIRIPSIWDMQILKADGFISTDLEEIRNNNVASVQCFCLSCLLTYTAANIDLIHHKESGQKKQTSDPSLQSTLIYYLDKALLRKENKVILGLT